MPLICHLTSDGNTDNANATERRKKKKKNLLSQEDCASKAILTQSWLCGENNHTNKEVCVLKVKCLLGHPYWSPPGQSGLSAAVLGVGGLLGDPNDPTGQTAASVARLQTFIVASFPQVVSFFVNLGQKNKHSVQLSWIRSNNVMERKTLDESIPHRATTLDNDWNICLRRTAQLFTTH